MALINCSECGKQISDKANACIHCGAPINVASTKEEYLLYKVWFERFVNHSMYSKNRIWVSLFVDSFLGENSSKGSCVNRNMPCGIADGISEDSANMIKTFMESRGCKITVEKSSLKVSKGLDENIKRAYDKYTSSVCPRCGSSSITTGQRGYSLLTGFLGSSKTTNRCSSCGFSWQPK